MFIRIKRIKGQHYAYKVRNKWTRKGTRQVILGYLGKVYKLESMKELENMEFKEFINSLFYNKSQYNDFEAYFKQASSRELIRDLIRYELFKHGFKCSRNGIRIKSEGLEVNLSELTVMDSKKPVVLGLNNDFLCGYTLRKLLNFKTNSDEEECGKELAEAFILAGIPVKPELFVEVFTKVYSNSGLSYVK